jgi:hypothetical protein
MSDTFLFGLRDDLIALFDIPPLSAGDEKEAYFPEQYIWTTFLRKKGIEITLQPNEMSLAKFAYSELALVDNFSLIEPETANIKLPQRFYQNARQTVYTQKDWEFLNDKYCLSPLYRIYRQTLPLIRWIEAIRQRRLSRLRWLRERIKAHFTGSRL